MPKESFQERNFCNLFRVIEAGEMPPNFETRRFSTIRSLNVRAQVRANCPCQSVCSFEKDAQILSKKELSLQPVMVRWRMKDAQKNQKQLLTLPSLDLGISTGRNAVHFSNLNNNQFNLWFFGHKDLGISTGWNAVHFSIRAIINSVFDSLGTRLGKMLSDCAPRICNFEFRVRDKARRVDSLVAGVMPPKIIAALFFDPWHLLWQKMWYRKLKSRRGLKYEIKTRLTQHDKQPGNMNNNIKLTKILKL